MKWITRNDLVFLLRMGLVILSMVFFIMLAWRTGLTCCIAIDDTTLIRLIEQSSLMMLEQDEKINDLLEKNDCVLAEIVHLRYRTNYLTWKPTVRVFLTFPDRLDNDAKKALCMYVTDDITSFYRETGYGPDVIIEQANPLY